MCTLMVCYTPSLESTPQWDEDEGGRGGGGCPKCRSRLKKCCLPRPLSGTADLGHLSATLLRDLAECGWYHGSISRRQAAGLLQAGQVGLFLLRDSSDPRFLFSLSVQTSLGPTSVRIHGSGSVGSGFRLDSEPSLAASVPAFPRLPALVQHYVTSGCPQLCLSGSKYSRVLLRAPLYRSGPPSLKHIARLAINRLNIQDTAPLAIPALLKKYLEDYPFKS